jgi:hypothetical protein
MLHTRACRKYDQHGCSHHYGACTQIGLEHDEPKGQSLGLLALSGAAGFAALIAAAPYRACTQIGLEHDEPKGQSHEPKRRQQPGGGARSWLGISSFGIQPSEFMKLGMILFLSQ